MNITRKSIVVSIAVVCAALSSLRTREPAAAEAGKDDPRAVIRASQAIAPGGISELKAIEIGGIPQWISVRGNDPANPILLLLHGGPGSPMMPVSWTFQHPWEDFFTVVQWDQRGAGKTLSSAGQKPGEKMTIDQMQADAEQVIEWLQHTYGKKKIFLLGHSWGSILGLRIAQHHPEWLYAYIGAGQVVNARRGEVVSYQETLARAEATGNTGAVQELKAMAPYPGPDPLPLDRIFGERQWVAALGGMMYGKTDADETKIRALSPDYTDKDVESAALGEMSSVQVLLPQMAAVNFDTVTDFKCPVFFFAGAQDRTVPTSVLVDYYGKIKAPKKGLFVVERAAHFVVSESPGEVLMHLVNDVRPLSQ